MRHPPLLSISKTEGLGAGKKENTPAVKSAMGLGHGKVLPEQPEDLIAIAVQVVEPTFRGHGIVFARPAPPLFQVQVPANPQEEFVGGHGSTTEEMFGHPVVLPFNLERVGCRAVAENMGK